MVKVSCLWIPSLARMLRGDGDAVQTIVDWGQGQLERGKRREAKGREG